MRRQRLGGVQANAGAACSLILAVNFVTPARACERFCLHETVFGPPRWYAEENRTMRTQTPDAGGSVTFDPDDLEGIYAYLQTMEVVQASDDFRIIVEENWPEPMHKLKPPRSRMH